MEMNSIIKKWHYVWLAIVLLIVSMTFPILTEFLWLNIIAKIREAINSGDSGPLLLASALYSIVYSVQNALVFLSALSASLFYSNKYRMRFILFMPLVIFLYSALSFTISEWQLKPWDATSGLFTVMIILLVTRHSYYRNAYFYRLLLVSAMIFFAFQWLNIIPAFALGPFGVTDIPVSIKLTSNYLNGDAVLNFVGLAFFIPLFLAAWIATALFLSHDRNISIEKENHAKEIELEALKSSAMEHRIYQEINSIAHDLKTPLVTIRGLNSLLALSGDMDKASIYSQKIDNAVEKMSDMISGFLYESSKQNIDAIELINYMRAQIPLDDENLRITLNYTEHLPQIYVNKIRVSRALLNIVENAIVVKTDSSIKEINMNVYQKDHYLIIETQDNGIGIPAEKIGAVWDAGYTTKNSTGLGLYFVKKIVEDNDGRVMIESEPGVGTTVSVCFPSIER